ncbi:MAG: helix-hairpin-helix domain-containing protein [Lapillicoccus sp.]
MPRPRAPVPPDPERLATLLAAARAARTARVAGPRPSAGDGGEAGAGSTEEPPRGWVPETAPPDADTSWLDDPWASESPDPTALAAPGQDDDEGPDDAAPAGRHRPTPRVLTVPTPFRGAHLTVRWRAVVGLLVVAVVAGLFFAVRVARAQQAAVPEPVPAGGGLVGRTAAPTAFGAGSGPGSGSPSLSGPAPSASGGVPSSGASTRRLVVDVVGQVTHPGVVSVPDGSRVGDVLAAVGGALPGADVQRLNLARAVGDGEQIFVPRPGESPPAPLGGGGGAVGPGAAAPSTSSAVIDLNVATLAMLDGLPGVGPVLAQRILDWRTEHGRFTSVDELGEVSGIGDKLLTQIRSKVRV